MNFSLSDEQELIRANIKEFCAKYIDPIATEIDENSRYPQEVFAKLGEMGFMGMPFSPEYGGAGLDYVTYVMVLEELARSCAATCVDLGAHTLSGSIIYYYGSQAQKQKYLIPLAQGDKLGAFAITEPGAGTDMGAMSTTAVAKGNEYVLNGQKTFITNGPAADVFVVLTYTDKSKGNQGMSAFIVPKDSPGLKIGEHFRKMGLRSSQTSEVIFQNCRIPEENLIGTPGQGMKIAMASLDIDRIGIAAQAIGIAQAALDESKSYSKLRVQFGKPIASNQAIQWMIADMATDISAARWLTYYAASLKNNGQPFSKEAAMAKLFASEMANKHASKAVQIHGGYGYIKGFKVERLMRDAKITEIYVGTSEAMRMIIAGSVLR
jgi:butyryl-CoA dehydrogenase